MSRSASLLYVHREGTFKGRCASAYGTPSFSFKYQWQDGKSGNKMRY
ncbi:MAG: hypothetical protein ACP5JB_05605 [candidate division WOR-3 bacterium]